MDRVRMMAQPYTNKKVVTIKNSAMQIRYEKAITEKMHGFPTTYRLPLGVKYKNHEIWNCVTEKFEKRLASWQKQYLSFLGQVNSYNSVLVCWTAFQNTLRPLPPFPDNADTTKGTWRTGYTRLETTQQEQDNEIALKILHGSPGLWKSVIITKHISELWKEVYLNSKFKLGMDRIFHFGKTWLHSSDSKVEHNWKNNSWNPQLMRNIQHR
ncbi:hypothetical protein H5410_057284 [Solanum commersonii]|uniref:Uncharacterized protein n=1 Tax=Solanum commersonii TaxID=4109 RepID=A0A9J5WQF1_SOLCO|nr:hypothetical protein H5410_057284 [Solanum commersonii]